MPISQHGHEGGRRRGGSEAWDALKRLDCDEAQGCYISPPLPAHGVRGWLEQSAWPLARKIFRLDVGETARTRLELTLPNNGKR
jgi:hypothetical protein